ncbi:uncharacterized protein LOC122511944 [Leptopilina heterotoma]|uniref:uncharacterized protein LOC122511944 n=1 Tax=Leptopilina heterotoma TaxID=63436 RepID=UPI001CA924C5|nr:uncharacterized protein LOC122511944 [Leptopilina heterotoma]
MDGWVSRYGSPRTITTDQKSQFESRIFSAFLQLIGTERIRTTSYHPASNGMVERWHRTLKAAIMCHSDKQWINSLRSYVGFTQQCVGLWSIASRIRFRYYVKGSGELILPEDFSPNRQIFLEEFREHMRNVKPIPVEHRHKREIFVHKNIYTCSHVFIRQSMIKKSLEPPYSGAHKVINRTSDRVFEVEVNGLKKQISVENLKPAYFIRYDALIVNNETNNSLNNVQSGPHTVTFSEISHFSRLSSVMCSNYAYCAPSRNVNIYTSSLA